MNSINIHLLIIIINFSIELQWLCFQLLLACLRWSAIWVAHYAGWMTPGNKMWMPPGCSLFSVLQCVSWGLGFKLQQQQGPHPEPPWMNNYSGLMPWNNEGLKSWVLPLALNIWINLCPFYNLSILQNLQLDKGFQKELI